MNTDPARRAQRIITRTSLCALLAGMVVLFVLPGTAAGRGRHVASPNAPLETILRPDGSLDLSTGFSGSLDMKGWKMTTDPDGTPRFVGFVVWVGQA